MQRALPLFRLEFFRKFFVPPANHNQLNRQSRRFNLLRNLVHHLGAKSAKQQDPGRQILSQTQLAAQSLGLRWIRHIKIRPQNHARSRKNLSIRFAYLAGLLHRALGSANHVLFFDRLNPEAWGKIRQVGNQGHERPPRVHRTPSLADRPVKMRNHRNQHVGGMLPKVIRQQFHQWPVENPDSGLQYPQKLGRTKRPSVPQKGVVLLLYLYSCQLLKHVKVVGQLLKLHQFHIPGTLLLFANRLQSHRCISMSASGVMEKHVNFNHWPALSHTFKPSSQEHTTCHVENLSSTLCSISSESTFTHNSRTLYALFISPV